MIGMEQVFAKVGKLLLLLPSSSICQRSTVSAYNCWSNTAHHNVAGVFSVKSVRYNSNRASICRVNRLQYLRHYPTLVVNPDGSTFTIRYREPRQIIKLPVDINVLSEPEKRIHLARRKPKTKVSLDDEFEDVDFDSSKYLKLVKKK